MRRLPLAGGNIEPAHRHIHAAAHRRDIEADLPAAREEDRIGLVEVGQAVGLDCRWPSKSLWGSALTAEKSSNNMRALAM